MNIEWVSPCDWVWMCLLVLLVSDPFFTLIFLGPGVFLQTPSLSLSFCPSVIIRDPGKRTGDRCKGEFRIFLLSFSVFLPCMHLCQHLYLLSNTASLHQRLYTQEVTQPRIKLCYGSFQRLCPLLHVAFFEKMCDLRMPANPLCKDLNKAGEDSFT